MGRTGQRGPFVLLPGTHTIPHPQPLRSQASSFLARGWEGPWRLQLRSHRPSPPPPRFPLPPPGTELGLESPPLQALKGVTLLSHWSSQV